MVAANLGNFVKNTHCLPYKSALSTGFLIMLIYANEGDVMQISMQIRSTINMATY